jgi:maleate isomerase
VQSARGALPSFTRHGLHTTWLRGAKNTSKTKASTLFTTRAALHDTGLNIHAGPLYEWARANVPKEAEAVFFGGNGMRAIGMIQALEEALGKPVLTSNQVTFWHALQLAKIRAKVVGYGQLFEKQLS